MKIRPKFSVTVLLMAVTLFVVGLTFCGQVLLWKENSVLRKELARAEERFLNRERFLTLIGELKNRDIKDPALFGDVQEVARNLGASSGLKNSFGYSMDTERFLLRTGSSNLQAWAWVSSDPYSDGDVSVIAVFNNDKLVGMLSARVEYPLQVDFQVRDVDGDGVCEIFKVSSICNGQDNPSFGVHKEIYKVADAGLILWKKSKNDS